jgi:ubiquinone/menaquinone biosynthesis C-methylase UbiE
VEHADHVALIRGGVEGSGGRWLELGAGRGAFTLALAELVGVGGSIVALDRDSTALHALRADLRTRFPAVGVDTVVADFSRPLPFTPGSFDGLLMANSLHFVRDKLPVIRAAVALLRPSGRFVLVEYGSNRGNPWVPWPIDFETWERLAMAAGLGSVRRIAEVPSRFLGSIYAAAGQRGN